MHKSIIFDAWKASTQQCTIIAGGGTYAFRYMYFGNKCAFSNNNYDVKSEEKEMHQRFVYYYVRLPHLSNKIRGSDKNEDW